MCYGPIVGCTMFTVRLVSPEVFRLRMSLFHELKCCSLSHTPSHADSPPTPPANPPRPPLPAAKGRRQRTEEGGNIPEGAQEETRCRRGRRRGRSGSAAHHPALRVRSGGPATPAGGSVERRAHCLSAAAGPVRLLQRRLQQVRPAGRRRRTGAGRQRKE